MLIRPGLWACIAILTAFTLPLTPCYGQDTLRVPEEFDLESALSVARPLDIIELDSGEYSLSGQHRVSGLRGKSGTRPIIRGSSFGLIAPPGGKTELIGLVLADCSLSLIGDSTRLHDTALIGATLSLNGGSKNEISNSEISVDKLFVIGARQTNLLDLTLQVSETHIALDPNGDPIAQGLLTLRQVSFQGGTIQIEADSLTAAGWKLDSAGPHRIDSRVVDVDGLTITRATGWLLLNTFSTETRFSNVLAYDNQQAVPLLFKVPEVAEIYRSSFYRNKWVFQYAPMKVRESAFVENEWVASFVISGAGDLRHNYWGTDGPGHPTSNPSAAMNKLPVDALVEPWETAFPAAAPAVPTGLSTLLPPASGFSLYPNPATEHIYVGERVDVIDTLGRQVAFGVGKVSVSRLPPGTYLVRSASGEVKSFIKL